MLNSPERSHPMSSFQASPRNNEEDDFRPATAAFSESFTLRATLTGLILGLVVSVSNMYFGLQNGYASQMTMASSLLGFTMLKGLKRQLRSPLTQAETCLVQTIAAAFGCIPSTTSLIGLIPAMQFLLTKEDQGPIVMSYSQLLSWSLGVAFFGVIWAMLLRDMFVVKENLPFPGARATAYLIKTLHKSDQEAGSGRRIAQSPYPTYQGSISSDSQDPADFVEAPKAPDWDSNIKALFLAGALSGFVTLMMHFLPALRELPVFGSTLAKDWMFFISLSPGFVGQGIIVGPSIPLQMLVGVLVGWGILSPLAKFKGWAPGEVNDWEHGSRGWIVFISLAALLADCVIELGWLMFPSCLRRQPAARARTPIAWSRLFSTRSVLQNRGLTYEAIPSQVDDESVSPTPTEVDERHSEISSSSERGPMINQDFRKITPDSGKSSLSKRTLVIFLIASVFGCVLATRHVFGSLVPIYAIVFAVALSLPFSVMGIRALGETDYNPMAGISKISQIIFALIIPRSNPSRVLINLIAGAITEAGAGQAGEIAFDLKVGELVEAAPEAQLLGQIIGSAAGTFWACFLYMLYAGAYPIPGELFQVPLSYIWILSAKVVASGEIPPRAAECATFFAVLIAAGTIVRIAYADKRWVSFIPGGVAFAIGIFNVPSFTFGRVAGGLLYWYGCTHRKYNRDLLIAIGSGLILGEGLLSVLNLVLAMIQSR